MGMTCWVVWQNTYSNGTFSYSDVTELTEYEALKNVEQLRTDTSTALDQSTEAIYTEVRKSYYTKDDTDTLLGAISTSIEQTAEAIQLNFNQFQINQSAVNQQTAAQFQDISKYIRFENGNIILGVEGNELTLRIQNDKIAFLENGGEIAYWQNRKFYAVDGEFINSLRLGKFAFLPRESGNLSFKKVVD